MGIVTDIVLPIGLAFIMFSLGLGLTIADFIRVAKTPRDFIIGAVFQILLLPTIAFLLIALWALPPEISLGVMIIAAAPGGVTYNILTSFARGDVALSISLTAVVSLLSVITIPLIVVLSYNHLIGGEPSFISVTGTALSVFVIVTIPVILGLLTRHFANKFATRFEPLSKAASSVLFVLILAGAIYQERSNIFEYFAEAGLITLTLNVIMMGLAFLFAKRFASGQRQAIAISIECGLQNGTLAIAISSLLFGGGLTIIPAATYSLIMFATALIFTVYLRSCTSLSLRKF